MKKKNIWIIIIVCSLILVGGVFLFFRNGENIIVEPENKKNKFDSGLSSLKIDLKELCKVEYDGMNSEAHAKVICNIPELEERKKTFEDSFTKQATDLIDTYTSEEKEILMNNRDGVIKLQEETVCKLNKNTNVKNGEELTISCDKTSLEALEYKVSNSDFVIKVEGLEVRPEDPFVKLEKEEANRKPAEPVKGPDPETTASMWKLNDGSLWVNPLDINEYNMDIPENEGDIILMIPEEKLDSAREKALENGVDFIVTGIYEYTKEDGFKNPGPFKGITAK